MERRSRSTGHLSSLFYSLQRYHQIARDILVTPVIALTHVNRDYTYSEVHKTGFLTHYELCFRVYQNKTKKVMVTKQIDLQFEAQSLQFSHLAKEKAGGL